MPFDVLKLKRCTTTEFYTQYVSHYFSFFSFPVVLLTGEWNARFPQIIWLNWVFFRIVPNGEQLKYFATTQCFRVQFHFEYSYLVVWNLINLATTLGFVIINITCVWFSKLTSRSGLDLWQLLPLLSEMKLRKQLRNVWAPFLPEGTEMKYVSTILLLSLSITFVLLPWGLPVTEVNLLLPFIYCVSIFSANFCSNFTAGASAIYLMISIRFRCHTEHLIQVL